MASAKEYGYFIKGQKLALIEKDTALSNDIDSRDYGPDVTNVRFKSPQSSVTDGIELEYIYSPKYLIDETDKVNTAIDTYLSLDGLLKFIDSASDNYSASPESLSDGSYIVLRKAGRWNGLHKVKDAGVGYITTYTKFSGSATVEKAFERAPDLYYNVDVLSDESDELPLSEYLSKAVVYYLKAKLAEDKGDFNLKQVMMREFYRIVEKSDNAKIHTIRKVAVHSAAIR